MNPLHIILLDAAGNFQFNEQLEDEIKQFDPFYTACFIGRERLGKSTLATEFSGTVFESKDGSAGCTKGVWASSGSSELRFLDFEGFSEDVFLNNKLFMMSVLLANVVVYNTQGVVTVEDIDKLQAAGSLATQIGGSSKPSLVYLLRNYELDSKSDQTDYFWSKMPKSKDAD